MSTTKSDEKLRKKPGQGGLGGRVALIWLLVWGAAASYFFVRSDTTDPAAVAKATPLVPARVSTTPQVQLKPIEQIKAGEQVMALDPASGQWAPHPVIRPLTHDYDGDLITIKIPGDTVEATGNHPFWVVQGVNLASRPPPHDVPQVDGGERGLQGQWVEARHLQVGDLLLIRSGKTATVEELANRQAKLKVYNLEVANVHTYSVGREGILVHNKALQVTPVLPTPASRVSLADAEARAALRGGGAYILRDTETGQALKVGQTRNFNSRAGDYASLQGSAGSLTMDIYPAQGMQARSATETSLRSILETRGDTLFWDGTKPRSLSFGFKPGEWILKDLVSENPGFGKIGWSLPLQQP